MRGLLLVATLTAVSVHAQPALTTDRPDFTESPTAVPLGRVQIELGATVATDAGLATASGPEGLVRWAPGRRAELRLSLPDVTVAGGGPAVGAIGAGGKVELGSVAGADVGAIAMLGVPLNGGRVGPEAILMAGRDVPFGSVGGQLSAVGAEGGTTFGATLVGGRALSDRVSAFLEVAADGRPGDPLALTLHHGYTLALGTDAQADLHAGLGLTGAAPAAFIGAGWSVRW